ncbi:MAG: hypothetical protein A2Z12_03335 [Actinobacteria bacterium RBG_16_68_21]|nr:MAG: hypothetical protein A2Z12_03335 [Actinobacteria bacterium RBG_16_68_21]
MAGLVDGEIELVEQGHLAVGPERDPGDSRPRGGGEEGTAPASPWRGGLRHPVPSAREPDSFSADVGQAAYEEIDVAPDDAAGNNYGWSIFEGDHCYSGGCDATGKVFPVLEVAHGDAGTCSIIGGFVYRGRALPEVAGRYFYGDYCGGWIRSFRYAAGSAVERVQWLDTSHHLTSFGVDSVGELYVATDEGTLYRIDPVR